MKKRKPTKAKAKPCKQCSKGSTTQQKRVTLNRNKNGTFCKK